MLAAIPVADRSARMEMALASAYDQLKDTKNAIAAYRRALAQDSDDLNIKRGLASALLIDGQLDEAQKLYIAILAEEPQDAQSQIRLSETQRRQGHYDQALETLEKAKPQAPDSMELSYNEALLYDALGRYDDAISLLKKVLEDTAHSDGKYTDQEKGNRAIFLDRLGIIYREQNKTEDAVKAYKQMLDLGDDNARSGYQGQVDAYRDAHQWKEATAASAEAAKAMPKDHMVQLAYAGQLADTGEVETGLALAKSQLTGTKDDREVYLSLAQIYTRLKRFDDARSALDNAEKFTSKPDDRLYLYFMRGVLADRQKQYDESEIEFRKALAIDPQNATILNYLGYSFADRGVKLDEALKMVQKAVELDPQNYAYLDSLGWAYFKLGQYALAEENIRKANERGGNDPTIHDHLGEIYARTGKLKQAVDQWERSLAEYARSLPADADPEDVAKVQHKLENARVKLAKLNSTTVK